MTPNKKGPLVSKKSSISVREGLSGTHKCGSHLSTNSKATGMLIVGASSFLRDKLKPQTLRDNDVYWVFIPTSEKYWTMSMIAVSKVTPGAAKAATATGKSVHKVVVEMIKFLEEKSQEFFIHPKIWNWMYLDLYRLPKITSKDVLHLQNYK